MLSGLIRFCLENKIVVGILLVATLLGGILVSPFDWKLDFLPRDPVPVDAIPDIGENQQIVFTEWMGRSPQDVEDQITYPLTVSLLGIPGVKSIRSFSFFGFSTVYVIFKDEVDFYWSRSRVLEKLNSLPAGTLPSEVQPSLGPDATPLGQVFWYTLEGRDEQGKATGGWDLQELRTAQDWVVRYALQSVDGVAEVASVGGYVQEYQIDVDPDAMRAHEVTLQEVFGAVRFSNVDVGARTIEVNRAEYVIRGLGLLKGVDDIRKAVIKVKNDVPIYVESVAKVTLGPALRRGALDKGGAEAVGGVVAVRFGANPLKTIQNVQAKIREISKGLPRKDLPDGTRTQIAIIPFYDRTGLIQETLGTLNTALTEEILVTIIVVLVMVMHLRSSLLITSLLPLAVLLCFLAMKYFGVDANIVALSGIAIAIGTMVDMGIVVTENILKHLGRAGPEENRLEVVYRGTREVGGAVLTAVATTVVSFLPVFAMEAAEGKLFRPLAFTKTFALIGSILVALLVLPPLAHLLFRNFRGAWTGKKPSRIFNWVLIALVGWFLAEHWEPLGPDRILGNLLFVFLLIGGFLFLLFLFQKFYERMLRWTLDHKGLFLALPAGILLFGGVAWLGFQPILGWIPGNWSGLRHAFPGLGKEFMPPLDEGSFLFMPTTMPHASIGESMDILRKQDMAIRGIPEVESVVGKIGRAESALDPAPISMIETMITYKPEYGEDEEGNTVRLWRDHIKEPDDIWEEILKAARIPGTTSAPRLQPIAARLVMLQSGMRAPMGVKVFGPDLESLEKAGLEIERLLKEVPVIEPATVIADRVIGKPYLEIDIDREAIARHGIKIGEVQEVIEVAVGGKRITTTVEGRERYPVRVRYLRELRDQIESLDRILVPAPGGAQIPLGQLSAIRYRPGPQVIKSEDTFLVSYVVFDKKPGFAEVEVVEAGREFLESEIASGELSLPEGVSFRFAGNYENQVRSEKKLLVLLPLALLIIFLILYFQFRSILTANFVFLGVLVAWAGGFILIWLYGQEWFLNISIFETSLRELFQIQPMNLSVAVWVGFLALFGIATDNGVLLATYLDQNFQGKTPSSIQEIRNWTVEAGLRRIRPCLMTTATTVLALLPILTSRGRGSDVMVPMAVPSFGGMVFVLVTVFLVPVLYCARQERAFRKGNAR